MGLDLALGGLVLVMAVRGWFRGFLLQAIRLGGLVAAAYAAAPVRDQLKPYALEYLPTIRPDVVDRLFWWAAMAVCYVVMVGVAKLALSLSRRQPYGLAPEPNRTDQFGGFALGAAKGFVLAAFLLAGVQRSGRDYLTRVPGADEQVRESMAWKWSEEYHPAARIWSSQPVQQFVRHVHRMGVKAPGTAGGDPAAAPVRTANAPRSPSLNLSPDAFEPTEADLSRALDGLQKELSRLETGK